jgi:hypothetical protein
MYPTLLESPHGVWKRKDVFVLGLLGDGEDAEEAGRDVFGGDVGTKIAGVEAGRHVHGKVVIDL